MNATEIQAEKAIEKLEKVIYAAKNGNQAGENAAVKAAEALTSDEFKLGYVIACANLINGWDRTTLAEHLIGEIGVSKFSDLKDLDLTDYDLDALRRILPDDGETVSGHEPLRASDVVECGRRM